MKLSLAHLVFAVVVGVAPAVMAGQHDSAMERVGQKAAPVVVVLAQAATPSVGATLQPDYLLTDCQKTPSTGPSWSAMRAVDPVYMLKNFAQNKYNRPVDFSAIKNVILLEGSTVGKITSVIDNTGRSWYRYDPPAGYDGKDQAEFMAEFEGKRYKIVVNIVVSPSVGESPLLEGEEPVCPPLNSLKSAASRCPVPTKI